MSAILKKIRVALTFNNKRQQSFLEDLASLLDDGVSIKEAINAIENIAKGSTKELAMSINSQLAQGKDFAQGLIGWFPPATVEVIRAGENSATLKESILAAAKAQKQQTSITSSLVNSITYPM